MPTNIGDGLDHDQFVVSAVILLRHDLLPLFESLSSLPSDLIPALRGHLWERGDEIGPHCPDGECIHCLVPLERDKRIALATVGLQHSFARFGDIGDHGLVSVEAALLGHGLFLEEHIASPDLLPGLVWRRHPIVEPAKLCGRHVADAIADVFGEVGHLVEDLLRHDGGPSRRGVGKLRHLHGLAEWGESRWACVEA